MVLCHRRHLTPQTLLSTATGIVPAECIENTYDVKKIHLPCTVGSASQNSGALQ